MVPAAHRGSHRCAQGDRERLPKSSRSGGVPAWVGTPSAGKTGHSDPDFFAPFSQKQGVSPPSASVCEEYRGLIEQGLARGRNGKAIWQDLVSDHGFAGDYQAVKRFVRKLRRPQRPEAASIILTAPGEWPHLGGVA